MSQPPRVEPRPIRVDDLTVSAADGVGLACRLWRPDGAGAWPTLLMRQPYGRAIASTVTYAHPSWYARQGYAVLVQDVRGRGASAGRFLGFRQEGADGSLTLTWLRRQPWCNGRIGTYGFSYQGLSQLLFAGAEPLPDALAPAMAGLDERLHWASEGGCHWWALGLAWALQLAAQGCRRRGDHVGWQAIRRSLEGSTFVRDGLELLQRLDPDGMGLNWLQRDPAGPDGWTIHEPPIALWRRPMLLIGGWHDPHLRGVLDLWERAVAGGGRPTLRVGAWSHLSWNGGIDRLQLSFFNRHLGTAATTPEAEADDSLDPATLLQDQVSGRWLERSPLQTSDQRWGLSSDGLATVRSDEGRLHSGSGQGRVSLVHDPWRPLPGRGGHLGLDAGPAERSDLDARCDVACFSSGAAETELELLGQPVLTIGAAADQPGFDLCVALSRITANGATQQLCTGVARFLGEDCRQMRRRRLTLQPLLARLPKGERLRLSIGLAAWPQITVNPGSGQAPLSAPGPDHREISVELDLEGASLCMLPMVGAN